MGELVDYNNPLVKYERELAARVGVRGRARALGGSCWGEDDGSPRRSGRTAGRG